VIDHETARRSFATSLDFSLEPTEGEALDAHLAGCPSCRAFAASLRSDATIIRDLETGPVSVAVRANVAIAAEHGRRSNPVGRWVGIAVFAALLLGVLGAGALGVGGRAGSGVPGPSSAAADPAGPVQIAWDTKVVSLSARAFEIDVRGKTFRAATPTVDVTSDPGTPTYRTLEATWKENGVAMRMNIYFAGDSSATWAEEIRISDGEDAGGWLTGRGIFFKAPLGAAWTGDADITVADPNGQPAHVRFAGLTLVNRPIDGVKPGTGIGLPPVGPIKAEVGSGPFDTGGQLHCSGILQMAPREAQLTLRKMGLKVTWRYYTRNDTYIEARDEPPAETVIIDDGTNVVGSAGQLLIALVDPTSPLAKPISFPADCPQADPNMTPPPPKR
jgi:hypothetical protein